MKPPSRQLGKFQKVGECLYRYSSNGVYYVVARHDGKLIRRSLETTDEELAKRKVADFKIELQRVDSSLGRMTVEELLKRFEARTRSRLSFTGVSGSPTMLMRNCNPGASLDSISTSWALTPSRVAEMVLAIIPMANS